MALFRRKKTKNEADRGTSPAEVVDLEAVEEVVKLESDSQAEPTLPAADVGENPDPVAPAPAAPTVTPKKRRFGFSWGGLFGSKSDYDFDQLEYELLSCDLGSKAVRALVEEVKAQVSRRSTPEEVILAVQAKLLELLEVGADRQIHSGRSRISPGVETAASGGAAAAALGEPPPQSPDASAPSASSTQVTTLSQEQPACILLVGVNGTGKTTTVAKLAHLLQHQGERVLLAACDTFRAAAKEQLLTWGRRLGVETVTATKENQDPASVAFDAVRRGIEVGADTVLIDTAGRFHTKSNLMDELAKVRRVVEKQAPVTEVLLVLDATTGQNGLSQALAFTEAVGVTGVVLTKTDGSAKGGVIIPIQQQLQVPVKLIGFGETVDDLAPFQPEEFAREVISA